MDPITQFFSSLFGGNKSTAVPNRQIAKVSRGGQAIATVHGTNRTAGATRNLTGTLGISTRFGGARGNASGRGSGGGRGK